MMKASDLPAALQVKLGIKKRSKYNVAAKADRTCDGIVFDSRAEMRRFHELTMLQRAGVVEFFLRQVPFHLPGGVVWRADFLVFMRKGPVSVEDVKGFRTAMYKLKKRQVEALYPIKIVEITK